MMIRIANNEHRFREYVIAQRCRMGRSEGERDQEKERERERERERQRETERERVG